MKQKNLEETWTRLQSVLGTSSHRNQSHRISKRAINSTRVASLHNPSTEFQHPNLPLSMVALKNIYKAKCKDMDIPILHDQESRFITFCMKNFNSRSFQMKESGLGTHSAKSIGKVLKNSNFAYINICKNSISNRGAYLLLSELSSSQTIVHLDISNNDITPEGLQDIVKFLIPHPSLISFDISSYEGLHRNRISIQGSLHLSQLLQFNKLLQFLNISGTCLSDGIESISQGLTYNKTLISLDISNNSLIGRHMENLSRAIVKTELKQLNLSCNKISDEGCEFLANMMIGAYEAGCPLVALNVSNNGITSKGAAKLFHSLRLNCFIKDFNASGNNFSQGLSMYFPSFLADNAALCTLNLSNCSIKPESLQYISEGLGKNKGLLNLVICNNKLEDLGIQYISEGLCKNKSLKHLDISCCQIKATGSLYLARALRKNQTLESLNLKDNSVKDDAGEAFVELTRTNKNLLQINLDLNPVNLKYVAGIRANLKDNLKSNKRQVIPKIKEEIYKIKEPLETCENRNEKIRAKLQEKEQMERRRGVENQSFEYAKEKEERRMKRVIDEHRVLKEKNVEVSRSFDLMQCEIIKLKVQSERKVEEVNFSLKLAAIEIEKALRERDSVAENLEGNKRRFKEALSLTQEAFTVENMTKISVNRVLNQLKEKLAERKLEVETLKSAQIIRIPAQFLASVKLAENKKKYSPTKSSRIIKKNQRSISANR